jgi:hypothetical protein
VGKRGSHRITSWAAAKRRSRRPGQQAQLAPPARVVVAGSLAVQLHQRGCQAARHQPALDNATRKSNQSPLPAPSLLPPAREDTLSPRPCATSQAPPRPLPPLPPPPPLACREGMQASASGVSGVSWRSLSPWVAATTPSTSPGAMPARILASRSCKAGSRGGGVSSARAGEGQRSRLGAGPGAAGAVQGWRTRWRGSSSTARGGKGPSSGCRLRGPAGLL